MAARAELAQKLILKVLQELDGPAGAARIAERLAGEGLDLRPRSVRFHLAELDRRGFTRLLSRRRGRELTEQGRTELLRSNIAERIGFIAARVDTLGYQMKLNTRKQSGSVIANIGVLHSADYFKGLAAMLPVFQRGLGMGDRLRIAKAGEDVGGFQVPQRSIAVATVCSITINGVFLHECIPVTSRFGGLLELRDYEPVRFVELVEYRGTTMDPLETYIRAGMTETYKAASSGSGLVGASFREIPSAAIDEARRIKRWAERFGLGGILAIGQPNRPLLDIPVSEGRAGMLVLGGLNPIAAIAERGIKISIAPLAGLVDIDSFQSYQDLL
jgi:HTH-type transcriptional regulator, global nitrogen regulator NrpRI